MRQACVLTLLCLFCTVDTSTAISLPWQNTEGALVQAASSITSPAHLAHWMASNGMLPGVVSPNYSSQQVQTCVHHDVHLSLIVCLQSIDLHRQQQEQLQQAQHYLQTALASSSNFRLPPGTFFRCVRVTSYSLILSLSSLSPPSFPPSFSPAFTLSLCSPPSLSSSLQVLPPPTFTRSTYSSAPFSIPRQAGMWILSTKCPPWTARQYKC